MTRPHQGERYAFVDAALEAMNAEQLRALIRAHIPRLDPAAESRLLMELGDRAARAAGGWTPTPPSDKRIAEIEAFAAAAKRVHCAEPRDVDDRLRDGGHAYLARDYVAACRIFQALLIPICDADIDLGQHEMVDEVLGVDVDTCAKQYVVATYMTSTPADRPPAVWAAIEDVHSVGYFFEPLAELERVAVEPLPDFDAFAVQWRGLVEARLAGAGARGGYGHHNRWLHEVVARTQGPAGLAEIARRSGRAADLRAWCRALADGGDWPAARAAYQEAAALVGDGDHARGEFLDGAALAAQVLASDDLDATLERCWRQAPSLSRLCRWLGGCATREELAARAAAALEVVPVGAARQRAVLHFVRGELEPAAALLADAPGLGWSAAEHPGHLVFPLLVAFLGGVEATIELPRDPLDIGSLAGSLAGDRPALRTPPIEALLRVAGVTLPKGAEDLRARLIGAMRVAAEKRVEGVVADGRRRHYGHAASLAVRCADADGSPAARAWLRGIMAAYRRYPALQREFEAAGA